MTTVADSTQNLPYLSQANFVGFGFDVTGLYAIPDSLILSVVDPAKAGRTTFDFLGVTYSIPDYVAATVDTTGRIVEDVGETREEIQNSFAATASVQAHYGAFSGEMEASYSREVASSSDYSYAYRNFYSRLAVLTLLLGEAQAALSDDFIRRYEALPSEVTLSTLPEFETFFQDFGVYVTSRVTLGGSLEYYSAVLKTAELSTTEISASVTAEYKGLFTAGAFSAEVTNTDAWKAYSANRTVSLSVSGGDPQFVSKLLNVDAGAASSGTLDLYDKWVNSIDKAPAVADFSLVGVWDLIPDDDKRGLVYEALEALHGAMRPRLVIETSAEAGTPPTITLGGVIRPDDPPEHPIGYQLVMLDRTDVSPRGVRFDKYYGVADEVAYAPYEEMYDQIAADIEEGGFESSGIVMILASYGMSTNAPPNAALYPLLRAAGGGDGLVSWVQHANPGSSMWVWPGSYVLVGIGSSGPDTGAELFTYDSARVSLEVFFYRQRGSKLYTPAVGQRQGGAPPAPASVEGPLRRDDSVSGSEQVYVAANV